MKKPPRIVLAVGPDVVSARKALDAHGLDPIMAGIEIRMVTRAQALRGWSRGTPVAACSVEDWRLTGPRGADLADALLACIAAGRLRLLQDHDIERLRAETA